MRYKKSNGYYNREKIYPAEDLKQKRRSFKQWLRDYLSEEKNSDSHLTVVPGSSYGGQTGFNKSFEGWNIRLHRANGGHIVEAWKSDDGPQPHNYRHPHELFMVSESEDMGARINDILVQLMLRG